MDEKQTHYGHTPKAPNAIEEASRLAEQNPELAEKLGLDLPRQVTKASEIAEREKFEKFIQGRFRSIEKHLGRTTYRWTDVQLAWESWERAIAESRDKPEPKCADNDPGRECRCGGQRGKPSCAFPGDRPTPTCHNCGWYLFGDACDRCGASKPEIPCICRDGLNNQLCQQHGAITESQAPQPEPSRYCACKHPMSSHIGRNLCGERDSAMNRR